MKKINNKLSRSNKKFLKQCLKKYGSTDPLFLIFQLTHHLSEIEEIAQISDIESNDLFKYYSVNQSRFLCANDDIESLRHLSPVSSRQILHIIKKNNQQKIPQTMGIVLDARYLRVAESEDLFRIGRIVRTWVDAIRNYTAQNTPILLAIRNMEDLDGFESWTQSLPEYNLDEAFGFAIPDEEIEAQSFIAAAFRNINEQLSKHTSSDSETELPGQPLIQSFNALKQNMIALTNGLIQTQPDLVPPRFVGLYFMGMVNHPVQQIKGADTDDESQVFIKKPAFVNDVCKDIFSKAGSYNTPYLPESRHVFFSKAMTFIVFIIMFLIMGALCMSYFAHRTTLQNTHYSITMLQKNITTPQDAIDYFHSLKYHIQALDTTISKWWLPWLGFSNDMDPLRDLKQQYVSTFRKYQLEPLMDQFMNRLRKHQSKRSSVTDSDEAFHLITGQLMGTLVYYADFLNQFIRSRHKDSFQFQPIAYQNGKGIFENPVSNEKFTQFMACYTHALIWAKNRRPFRKDFYQFQTSIEEMVALMPDLMEWTLPVVNDQIQGINLPSLWINDLETNDPDSFINAAYTKKGFDYIQNFFSVIRQAHSTPATFDERKKAFNKIYTTNYLQKWEKAAKAFSNCSTYLETRSAWADTLASLYDIHKNPYFQMIALIVDHTRSFHENRKKWPKWLQFSHRLHEQTVLANANLSLTEVSSSSAINSEAANAFNGYLAALKDIAQLPNTPGVSYKIIKTLFSNSETFCPGDGPDTMACLSIFQLQSIWEKRNDQNAAFWDLYEGPMTLIRQFSMRETACQLQQTWENYVLSVDLQSSSLVRQQKAGMQKFIQSEASHFLEKITQTRYAPKRLAGLIVPFRDSFFKYVAYHPKPQELKDRYPVIIKATPSRTNPQAESQPQLTLIKMKCNQNQQILVIGHQPAQETFYWSESCGPVHITFHLNDMKLTRTYPNPMAFPKFVRDVQYGSKRFHQSEFVLQKARLKSLHVDYVELKLQLFGHETIAKAQKRGFMTAPEKITYCWETTAPQVVRDEPVEKKEAQEKADLAEKPESDIEKQDIEKQDTERPEIEKSPEVSSREHVYITILASFRSDANAIKKAKQLTQDGLNSAVYWLKDDNENLWYIVVSGIYADYDQAMGAVNEIKTNYNIMPFVKKMAHATIKKRRVNIIF